MKNILLLSSFSILLFGCATKVYNCKPSTLIDQYCPNGPNSCSSEKIDVEGYLDRINIYDNKIFLWSSLKSDDTQTKNRFIEVYHPKYDLSKIFAKNNDHYQSLFDVKVIIHGAEIKSTQIATSKVATINYLSVDSIQQIEFYKIEKNNKLTKLAF
ncbi:MAG: hypothetical protein WCK02_14860 [Bacteroidota bacterium]